MRRLKQKLVEEELKLGRTELEQLVAQDEVCSSSYIFVDYSFLNPKKMFVG